MKRGLLCLVLVTLGSLAAAQDSTLLEKSSASNAREVIDSIRDRVFVLSEPVNCLGRVTDRGGEWLVNQCPFEVDIVACARETERSTHQCSQRLENMKHAFGTTFNLLAPSSAGPQNSKIWLSQQQAKGAFTVMFVACPTMRTTEHNRSGNNHRIWQIEQNADGSLAGKCFTEYKGPKPSPGQVKLKDWPYYQTGYWRTNQKVAIFEQGPVASTPPGRSDSRTEASASVPSAGGSTSPPPPIGRFPELESARAIRVPSWK